MIGAAWFAVNGITDTLGQEKEKSRPVYIATEGVAEATYSPEAGATETQPTETAKATEEPLIASMDWDKDDSYMLCKIAMAEAESEGVEGKALVMLVVLNRVWSEEFPDTIEEVIFQKNQFSPVANGRYDEVEPDKECYEALEMIQVEHWNESQDKELERLVQISARESIKAYISETEKIESNRHKREMSDLLQRYREIKATLRNTEGISSESDKKRPENERLIARIEKASDLFRIECERIGTPESTRRFKVMQGLFLSDRAYSTPEIAEKYMVTTKCIYKDLSLIYERMAFYFARV